MRKYVVNQIGNVMASEIAEIPAVFTKLLDTESQFTALANLLKNSEIRSVLVLARGTSDNAAHFLKYLIETQLGLPVGLTSPSSVTIYRAKLNFENTLIVAISQSGQSTDLVEYAAAAKTAGAKLISITNDEQSPLAKLAEDSFGRVRRTQEVLLLSFTLRANVFTDDSLSVVITTRS